MGGLTQDEARERLSREGPNAVAEPGRRTELEILLLQFTSPLVLILIAASLISIAVGEHVDAVIILVIIGLSAALGFVQEARSEAAVTALRARLALRATVFRDGEEREVPVRDLVRGDLVVLNAGDIVPADGRLIDANHLYVDESALTGESSPALKAAAWTNEQEGAEAGPVEKREADRDRLVFFGTTVVSGTGGAELTATGARTAYGLIARRLAERPPETDFQRGVRRFGFLIVRVTLVLVIGVFAVNVALQRPFFESLLFAIALAVGLTPELLPAIVTVNLGRGARALARRGVLVRRLPAIQNLGSMTVLCTDKTGTLTEGRLTFDRALDADGEAAEGAVGLAFLNSHFQTGFTNPLDLAVLAAGTEPADLERITKLAELPFDFQRRCLSIAVARPDGTAQLIVKGAPEAILARSNQVRTRQGIIAADRVRKSAIMALVETAAKAGTRTIAVGSCPWSTGKKLEPDDEAHLVFEGLLLFSDPPKAGIKRTLSDLAGLRVGLKILTGDNALVARAVARQVGLKVEGVLTGEDLDGLSHPALVARATRTTIFARVDPDQKLRVIRALQERDEIVGYLGDGINDAPPLHVADVGISVDNATDVARAAAEIVLLQPSLDAIAAGVREGRRTFANTLKYIRMGASSNFGNMLSMAGAAFFLPFLPMLPSQILLNNLIYDASQTAIPTDDIDAEAAAEPAAWDVPGIERFMLLFGPISSIFDYLTFGFLLVVLRANESTFHTGWFVESLATQVLVIFVIRTRRSPFWRSRPSLPLTVAAFGSVALGVVLPLSPLSGVLGFAALPLPFWLALAAFVVTYLSIVEAVKRWYWRRPSPRPPSGGAARGSSAGPPGSGAAAR